MAFCLPWFPISVIILVKKNMVNIVTEKKTIKELKTLNFTFYRSKFIVARIYSLHVSKLLVYTYEIRK